MLTEIFAVYIFLQMKFIIPRNVGAWKLHENLTLVLLAPRPFRIKVRNIYFSGVMILQQLYLKTKIYFSYFFLMESFTEFRFPLRN